MSVTMRGAGVNDGHGSGADLIHTIGPRWRQWKGESETTAEGRCESECVWRCEVRVRVCSLSFGLR